MYEKNYYLRLLDGKDWCIDKPENPSLAEVAKRFQSQSSKWASDSSSFEVRAYLDGEEYKEMTDGLKDEVKLEEQRRLAVRTIQKRVEDFLSDVFSTLGSRKGKPFIRDYVDGGQKPGRSQIDNIALKFRCSRDFVLGIAGKLGVEVRGKQTSHLPDPKQASLKENGPTPPAWVWDTGKNEVYSKFEIGTWVTNMRARLELMPDAPEDLYRFIGVSSEASQIELKQRIDESKQKLSGNDYRSEIGKNLCAVAEEWLLQDNSRKLYDAMLRLDKGGVFDFLENKLPEWIDRIDGEKVISSELWEEAVDRVSKNASRDEAEWLVWHKLSKKMKCKCLPPDISEILREIERCIDNKEFKKAIDKANEALKKSPNDSTAKEYLEKAEKALAEEERERSRKIRELKDRFGDMILAGEWSKAENVAQELLKLGEGTAEEWKRKIAEAKDNRKATLERKCKEELDDFDTKFRASRLEDASGCLDRAKTALAALQREFKSSTEIDGIRRGIAEREDRLSKEGTRLRVASLPGVVSLTAEGSLEGSPRIVVSWKPAKGGTKVDKWRLSKNEKGASGKARSIDLNVESTSLVDDGTKGLGTMKLGTEYIYSVMPLAECKNASGESELRANENAVVRCGPAMCLAPMDKDGFSGTGQGMVGVGGSVKLRWKMPDGLQTRTPHRFLLSRGDGSFSKKDVTACNGVFEDSDVLPGKTIEYSLALELFGRDMGTVSICVPVRMVPRPSPVKNMSFGRTAQGSLLVKWEWPDGLDSCIWGVTDAEVHSPKDIPEHARRIVSKETYIGKGGVIAQPFDGGAPCWIWVFGTRSFGDREFYSVGESMSLAETKLTYAVDTHPGGLFSKRKPASLVIESTTGYIPELDIRAAPRRADVLSPGGGRSAKKTKSERNQTRVAIRLDGIVKPGEFIRVYLVHPDAENCQIVSPQVFEVR